jgi:predicted dehydrogenase/CheY-like chemotaxis protein
VTVRPDTVRFGVLGCGYWGPNHIRNLTALRARGAVMAAAADPDEARRRHIADLYPGVRLVPDADELIEATDIDALVIATPVGLHFDQARRALENGKHVLVEKPFTTSLAQARRLAEIAAANERVLMVGHTYQYSGAVNDIRDRVRSGELGELSYIRSLRVNLGLLRTDANVIWDLAPHDVSILLHVLERMPLTVQANAMARISRSVEDVASITLDFGEQLMANVIVSWLDPQKVRQMTFVGDRKMLVYDDISPNEKIRIFDKGIDVPRHWDSFGDFQYSYRYGDIVTPMIEEKEPMLVEDAHFLECCRLGKEPTSGSEDAVAVTGILEAAMHSVATGKLVVVDDFMTAGAGAAPTGDLDTMAEVVPLRPPRPEAKPVPGRRRALVIDPSQDNRAYLTEALTSFEPGFKVVTVASPGQAAEWMSSFTPDLVVVGNTADGHSDDEVVRFVDRLLSTPDSRHSRVVSFGRGEGAGIPGSHAVVLADAGLSDLLRTIRRLFDAPPTRLEPSGDTHVVGVH